MIGNPRDGTARLACGGGPCRDRRAPWLRAVGTLQRCCGGVRGWLWRGSPVPQQWCFSCTRWGRPRRRLSLGATRRERFTPLWRMSASSSVLFACRRRAELRRVVRWRQLVARSELVLYLVAAVTVGVPLASRRLTATESSSIGEGGPSVAIVILGGGVQRRPRGANDAPGGAWAVRGVRARSDSAHGGAYDRALRSCRQRPLRSSPRSLRAGARTAGLHVGRQRVSHRGGPPSLK